MISHAWQRAMRIIFASLSVVAMALCSASPAAAQGETPPDPLAADSTPLSMYEIDIEALRTRIIAYVNAGLTPQQAFDSVIASVSEAYPLNSKTTGGNVAGIEVYMMYAIGGELFSGTYISGFETSNQLENVALPQQSGIENMMLDLLVTVNLLKSGDSIIISPAIPGEDYQVIPFTGDLPLTAYSPTEIYDFSGPTFTQPSLGMETILGDPLGSLMTDGLLPADGSSIPDFEEYPSLDAGDFAFDWSTLPLDMDLSYEPLELPPMLDPYSSQALDLLSSPNAEFQWPTLSEYDFSAMPGAAALGEFEMSSFPSTEFHWPSTYEFQLPALPEYDLSAMTGAAPLGENEMPSFPSTEFQWPSTYEFQLPALPEYDLSTMPGFPRYGEFEMPSFPSTGFNWPTMPFMPSFQIPTLPNFQLPPLPSFELPPP